MAQKLKPLGDGLRCSQWSPMQLFSNFYFLAPKEKTKPSPVEPQSAGWVSQTHPCPLETPGCLKPGRDLPHPCSS